MKDELKQATNLERPSISAGRGLRLSLPPSTFIIHLLVCLLGLFAAFHPTILSGFERMQADPGDTVLNHYILEHSWQWLTRPDYVGTLWSPPFYYPTTGALAYSENLLGVAPLYWLCRLVAPDHLAYQLWMMLVSALTYASAAAVLRLFGVRHLLCALGAYWFAFGLPRLVQIGHQQLLGHFFAPPALWCLWTFLSRPRTAALAGLAACLFLQLAASFYLGWFLALGLTVFAAMYCWHDRTTFRRVVQYLFEHRVAAAGVVLTTGILTAALMAPYFEANRGFRRQMFECLLLLPRWNAWLAPGPFGPWAAPLKSLSHGLVSEQYLFLGFTFLGLTAVTAAALAWRRSALGPARRRLAIVCLAAAAVLVVISLRGSGNFTAWSLICKVVPGSRAIRVGARIAGVVYLLAITGGLVALEGWLRRWRQPSWITAGVAALFACGIAEQVAVRLPSFDKTEFASKVERIERSLASGSPAYVEIEPSPNPIAIIEQQLAAMWAGLRANAPVVNGYSGRYPTNYPDCLRPMTLGELSDWLTRNGKGNVAIVTMHRRRGPLDARLVHSTTDASSWPSSPTKPGAATGN